MQSKTNNEIRFSDCIYVSLSRSAYSKCELSTTGPESQPLDSWDVKFNQRNVFLKNPAILTIKRHTLKRKSRLNKHGQYISIMWTHWVWNKANSNIFKKPKVFSTEEVIGDFHKVKNTQTSELQSLLQLTVPLTSYLFEKWGMSDW